MPETATTTPARRMIEAKRCHCDPAHWGVMTTVAPSEFSILACGCRPKRAIVGGQSVAGSSLAKCVPSSMTSSVISPSALRSLRRSSQSRSFLPWTYQLPVGADSHSTTTPTTTASSDRPRRFVTWRTRTGVPGGNSASHFKSRLLRCGAPAAGATRLWTLAHLTERRVDPLLLSSVARPIRRRKEVPELHKRLNAVSFISL